MKNPIANKNDAGDPQFRATETGPARVASTALALGHRGKHP